MALWALIINTGTRIDHTMALWALVGRIFQGDMHSQDIIQQQPG